MNTSTPAHHKMSKVLLELADTAVQLAQEAAEAAQRMAAKSTGADWAYHDDIMILAGEQAVIAEHMAEIAEETGEANFVQLAQATHDAVSAAANSQAIAGLELTAVKLMGIFENPLFRGIEFDEGPVYAQILPSHAAKKTNSQKAPAKNTQQSKPKQQPAGSTKAVVKSESKGKLRGLWWTLAALVIALFLI